MLLYFSSQCHRQQCLCRPVEFKKCPCGSVDCKGRGPYLMLEVQALPEAKSIRYMKDGDVN